MSEVQGANLLWSSYCLRFVWKALSLCHSWLWKVSLGFGQKVSQIAWSQAHNWVKKTTSAHLYAPCVSLGGCDRNQTVLCQRLRDQGTKKRGLIQGLGT